MENQIENDISFGILLNPIVFHTRELGPTANWHKNGTRIVKAPLALYTYIDQDFMVALLEDSSGVPFTESEQSMMAC